MATNTTPSEFAAAGLAPTGEKPRPPEPNLTQALKALGVTGFKWNEKAWEWRPVMEEVQLDDGGGGDKPKPPPDPYAPVIRQFFTSYLNLWGTLPPPGYVEKRAREMNLYEFLEAERKKPAFRETKTYRDEAARFAAMRDQLLGYY